MTEKRTHPIRRQMNAAFCDPSGAFSIKKFLLVWAQIVVLAHMGTSWEDLIKLPTSLMVVLVFLAAPEMISKFLSMKLGSSK